MHMYLLFEHILAQDSLATQSRAGLVGADGGNRNRKGCIFTNFCITIHREIPGRSSDSALTAEHSVSSISIVPQIFSSPTNSKRQVAESTYTTLDTHHSSSCQDYRISAAREKLYCSPRSKVRTFDRITSSLAFTCIHAPMPQQQQQQQ